MGKPRQLAVCSEHVPSKDDWQLYEEKSASDSEGAQTI